MLYDNNWEKIEMTSSLPPSLPSPPLPSPPPPPYPIWLSFIIKWLPSKPDKDMLKYIALD